jgi:hypothetical protein
MPTTPRELLAALDKHPDFKLGLLKLLLEDAKIADVWEWGVPDNPKDGGQPNFRRLTSRGTPLAVVWCKIPPEEYYSRFGRNGSEWTWVIYDHSRLTPLTSMARGTATSHIQARKAVDDWLRADDWTVPGTHLLTE